MKKDNDLKNINVNEIDGIKNIYDGCKFCMKERGRLCNKAKELFKHHSVLSSYPPEHCSTGELVLKRQLFFPLKCYEYAPYELNYCCNCKIVYKSEDFESWLLRLESTPYASRLFAKTCPHCGKRCITYVKTMFEDIYGADYDDFFNFSDDDGYYSYDKYYAVERYDDYDSYYDYDDDDDDYDDCI